MSLTKDKKREAMNKFRANAQDTGSPAVQVSLITERINSLSSHFKTHVKDHSSRRGLLQLVGQRKKLLQYLLEADKKKYQELVEKLGLKD